MNKLPSDIVTYIHHVLPNTEGWCSPEKATFLANHVLTHKPTVCVEIGVFAGRSLYAIALALKHNGSGSVLGIDPWDSGASIKGFEDDPPNKTWWAKCDHNYIYREFMRKLELLNLAPWVDVFTGTSKQALSVLNIVKNRYMPRFIQLLHIDGNHSQEQALFDVNNYVPLVEPGGYVVFDDCDWLTTKRAQERLAELCDSKEMIGNCGVFQAKQLTPEQSELIVQR